MKSYRLILLSMLSLAGCGITGKPVPQDHFYRLPEVKVEVQDSSALDSLQLVSVTADGLYNERNLLYVDASRPLEVSRYHYHYWIESPLTLVGKYMVDAIKTSHIASQFSGPGEQASADARMSIQIVRFERIIGSAGVSVQVVLLVTMDYRPGKGERWQKLYKTDKSIDSTDMQDTARAFGDALNSISQMLIHDMAGK